jgi:hypothetical protein
MALVFKHCGNFYASKCDNYRTEGTMAMVRTRYHPFASHLLTKPCLFRILVFRSAPSGFGSHSRRWYRGRRFPRIYGASSYSIIGASLSDLSCSVVEHNSVLGPPLGGDEQAFLEGNAKKRFLRFTQADKLRRRERPGGVLHPSMPSLGKEAHLEVTKLMEAKARGRLGASIYCASLSC